MLTRDEIESRDTWAALAPDFHIGDDARFRAAPAQPLGENLRADLSGQLRADGYFHETGLDWGADPAAARHRLGVLPDARGLYKRLTARENIVYFGRLQGLSASEAATDSGPPLNRLVYL